MMPREPFYPPVDPQLKSLFQNEGLILLGVAEIQETDVLAQKRFRDWLAEGRHGSMSYLERHEKAKYDPRSFFPEVRSLLIVGMNYFQKRPESEKKEGLVARYAWGRDYHKVLLGKLKNAAAALAKLWPEETFRAFTDTAPIDERYWAQRAGIGFNGKNTLNINSVYGSWFFLGEILSSKFFPSPEIPRNPHGACPSGCKRCKNICPTGALDEEYRIDARRCISYLTIEHKGSIPVELRPAMGSWLFGCDLCQDVCPFNLKVQETDNAEFRAWKAGPELELASILSIVDDTAFTARFGGSPVHRAGRLGLIRNACIAAANMRRHDLLPLLKPLSEHEDPVVAETASWAVETLNKFTENAL